MAPPPGIETLLAGALAVSFEAGQEYDRPQQPDPILEPGLENGVTDLRSLRLVLDTGKEWVPVIEHRWDRSRSDEGIAVVTAADPQVATAEIDRESLLISERLEHDIGLAQWFSYSRTWTRDARGLLDASGVPLSGGTERRGLVERARPACRGPGRRDPPRCRSRGTGSSTRPTSRFPLTATGRTSTGSPDVPRTRGRAPRC